MGISIGKFAAAISVAAAAMSGGVAFGPAAAADTCPYDMSTPEGQKALSDATVAASQQVSDNQAAYGPAGNQSQATTDLETRAANSRLILACSGQSTPESMQALDNTDQMVANQRALEDQRAADEAAMNAPQPGVLPNGQPDCAYYQAKVDSIPTPVEIGFLAIPDRFDPQNVVLTCGLANSVIGGVSLLTGGLDGAVESGQQAGQAFCNTGARVIPFVTLPLGC